MIIAIIILAVLLVLLLFRPQRGAGRRPVEPRWQDDSVGDNDGGNFGQMPVSRWDAGPMSDETGFTPGGGESGGGGASGDWGFGDSGGDSGGD